MFPRQPKHGAFVTRAIFAQGESRKSGKKRHRRGLRNSTSAFVNDQNIPNFEPPR
jgi:hypothetical protein